MGKFTPRGADLFGEPADRAHDDDVDGGVLMAGNVSSAVMAQRHSSLDSLDFLPTPPWATRAFVERVLMEAVGFERASLFGASVLEPSCGRGHMVRPLREYFGSVDGFDIFDHGEGFPTRDFLDGQPWERSYDFVIGNPPFKAWLDFTERALDLARVGVAMFARLSIVEGQERFARLYDARPPTLEVRYAERVVLFEGRCLDPDVPYWDPKGDEGRGKWKKPASATAYCWMVWVRGMERRRPVWIPPCRRLMQRAGDYDPPSQPPGGVLLEVANR